MDSDTETLHIDLCAELPQSAFHQELLRQQLLQVAVGHGSFSHRGRMMWRRVGEELFLYLGGRVGYWRGDIKGLVDDIGELKPTIFIGVPRVFERIYTGVNAKVGESKVKGFLYHWGFKRKLYSLDQGHAFNHVWPLLPLCQQ